ncbi:MAG: aminodeoxychorismate synthase component I [bacterium]
MPTISDRRIIPLKKKIKEDTLVKLTEKQKNRVLLSSNTGNEDFGRYSLLSFNPLMKIYYERGVLVCEDCDGRKIYEKSDFRKALSTFCTPLESCFGSKKEHPFFKGVWAGFMSYESTGFIESVPRADEDLHPVPDICFVFSDVFIVSDHVSDKSFLVILDTSASEESMDIRRTEALKSISGVSEISVENIKTGEAEIVSYCSRKTYINIIEKIKNYIEEGDVYQVNFTVPFKITSAELSGNLFIEYIRKNPVDFAAFMNFRGREIISISPESFFSLRGSKIAAHPIKGTIRRGKNCEEDKFLREQLLKSSKDRAELSMIVDLLRNDIGKIAEKASVSVENHASLLKFPTLYHLVSEIIGFTDASRSEIITSLFPGGSITGAPKIRAMEIITECEKYRRGVYTGAVGWIGYSEDMAFNIPIRTIQRVNDKLFYHSGGGIVLDSDPQKEYEEMLVKVRSFVNIFSSVRSRDFYICGVLDD